VDEREGKRERMEVSKKWVRERKREEGRGGDMSERERK